MSEPSFQRAKGTAKAIGRSLRLYHGKDAPRAAMAALYARFVPHGGLAFDIGSHVGDRVSVFRQLGARVVALEPQPGPMRALQLIHGRDEHVTLIANACGPQQGEVTFHLNTANPTVSTASGAFLEAADGAAGWEGQIWDQTLTVPMTTLDALMARFGKPDFVKIDVEGFEADVLAGLTQPVPALSFEFTTIQRDVAHLCLGRLTGLGLTRFNIALGESQTLSFAEPVSGHDMAAHIAALPHEANSGDVYAMM
ncbi:MAG: FkbM family methyltransferase [Bosea sp. (in: a-proteobacteria)]